MQGRGRTQDCLPVPGPVSESFLILGQRFLEHPLVVVQGAVVLVSGGFLIQVTLVNGTMQDNERQGHGRQDHQGLLAKDRVLSISSTILMMRWSGTRLPAVMYC